MERYDVYMYNLPKVEDEKLIAPGNSQTKQFPTAEEAKKFMAEHKSEWERIVLIQTVDNVQKGIERYRYGEIEPFPPPREEPTV